MYEKRKSFDIKLDRRGFIKTAAATGVMATITAAQARPLVAISESASDPGAQKPDKERYPHLFSPMKIAGYTFKNRILVAPMVFGFMVLREGMPEIIYKITEEKAKGGAAEVVVLDLVSEGAAHTLTGMILHRGTADPVAAVGQCTAGILHQVGGRVMGVGVRHRAMAGQALVFDESRQLRKYRDLVLQLRPEVWIVEGMCHDAVLPLVRGADVGSVIL